MDYNKISQTFFRPVRSNLLEALECVLGRKPESSALQTELDSLDHKRDKLSNGKTAWESLAARGLIPMHWVDDTRRSFHLGSHSDLKSHPSSKMSVLLAAHVSGITTAENLARETVSRLSHLGRPVPDRVLWKMGVHLPRNEQEQFGETILGDKRTGVADIPVTLQIEGHGGWVPYRLARCISNHIWWEQAAKNGWRVSDVGLRNVQRQFPNNLRVSPIINERLFSELPNPCEPELQIWEVGYALIGLTAEYLVLFACSKLCPDTSTYPANNYRRTSRQVETIP
jgi:hypothetical protein